MTKRVFGQDAYDSHHEKEIDFPREPHHAAGEKEDAYPVLRARPKLCECGHSRILHGLPIQGERCLACECKQLRVQL